MKSSVFALGLALLLCGCSKKSTTGADVPEPPKSAASQQVNPMITEVAVDINKKLQAQEFEAAVGAMMSMKMSRMSEKDDETYQKQLDRTLDALQQRIDQGDQRALAAKQMLGRMITGR